MQNHLLEFTIPMVLDSNGWNARSHVSKKIKLWKDEKIPLNIDPPPHSPDINAIEFVWKYLKDYVEKQ